MFPLYRVSFSSHVCIVIATYFVRTSFQRDYFAEWFQYRSKVITKYCNGKVLIFIVWREKTIFKVKCDSMLLPFPIEECLRWFFYPKKQRFKKKTILIGFLILLLCFIQRKGGFQVPTWGLGIDLCLLHWNWRASAPYTWMVQSEFWYDRNAKAVKWMV